MDRVIWEQHPVLRDPAAIIAFEGWGDAGESSSAAARHLIETVDSERIASIDADEFFDFQVRRPVVLVDDDGSREIAWPETEIWMVTPPWSSRDLVVVTGPEPHARWKVFSTDLIAVLRTLGVRQAVTMGAFIGQVPHTLPVPLVGSGVDPDTLERHALFASDYEGPTGIVGVLNSTLTGAGIETVSVWAAVPHYLSQQEYPPGALALVDKALEIVGMELDTTDLTLAVSEFRDQVDAAMDDAEIREYVEELENQSLVEEETDGDPVDRLVEEIEDFLRDS
ncbi:MAG TPA: PAC2 family protein [Acidimicrobiia bacterium]|nr:PAC2 family protein [Acidimicrobiia bacterium]